MPWVEVILLGLFGKVIAKILAPFVVPFIDREDHPIWGVRDADDLSYWNIAIRNGAHNLFERDTPAFKTTGNTDDPTLEKLEGFQWRRRESLDGKYVSFRMTWGKPRDDKGKREFYVGWTMNENDTMRLTFFQLRIF